MELLRTGHTEELAALAAREPRAVRPLLGRLFDPDPAVRRSAGEALGAAAVARPEQGLEVIRRLMWFLNDESASNGVYGLTALGEIGRCAPHLMAPFVGPLISLAWDDSLRPALLEALARMVEVAPELVTPHAAELGRWIDDTSGECAEELRRLVADERGGM